MEISQLKSSYKQQVEEVRRLEHTKAQAVEEIKDAQRQREELQHALEQVRGELQTVLKEKAELQTVRANGIVKENQLHEEELLNLRNELSSVRAKLQQYSEGLSSLNAELQMQKEKNDVSV